MVRFGLACRARLGSGRRLLGMVTCFAPCAMGFYLFIAVVLSLSFGLGQLSSLNTANGGRWSANVFRPRVPSGGSRLLNLSLTVRLLLLSARRCRVCTISLSTCGRTTAIVWTYPYSTTISVSFRSFGLSLSSTCLLSISRTATTTLGFIPTIASTSNGRSMGSLMSRRRYRSGGIRRRRTLFDCWVSLRIGSSSLCSSLPIFDTATCWPSLTSR